MKHAFKTTLLAVAALGISQAYAARYADAPVELPEYTVDDISALPTPTHHPIPRVSMDLVGTKLKIKLTIDEKGRPNAVRLTKPLFLYFSDFDRMGFASEMEDLVARWKFEPARNTAGDPVPVKVIMPVHVVKKDGKTSTLASLILDTGDEDAS